MTATHYQVKIANLGPYVEGLTLGADYLDISGQELTLDKKLNQVLTTVLTQLECSHLVTAKAYLSNNDLIDWCFKLTT